MIGVGFLFATAIGFVQVAPRSAGSELSRAFVDSMEEGLVVADAKGRILYANNAYAQMTGATSVADVKTVDALLAELTKQRRLTLWSLDRSRTTTPADECVEQSKKYLALLNGFRQPARPGLRRVVG